MVGSELTAITPTASYPSWCITSLGRYIHAFDPDSWHPTYTHPLSIENPIAFAPPFSPSSSSTALWTYALHLFLHVDVVLLLDFKVEKITMPIKKGVETIYKWKRLAITKHMRPLGIHAFECITRESSRLLLTWLTWRCRRSSIGSGKRNNDQTNKTFQIHSCTPPIFCYGVVHSPNVEAHVCCVCHGCVPLVLEWLKWWQVV